MSALGVYHIFCLHSVKNNNRLNHRTKVKGTRMLICNHRLVLTSIHRKRLCLFNIGHETQTTHITVGIQKSFISGIYLSVLNV